MTAPQPAHSPDHPGCSGDGSETLLLHVISEALLDALVLLEPVRDPSGRIADFIYREANPATCTYLGKRREELIGQSVVALFPDLQQSGLMAHYIHCAETGEPLCLDDFKFFNGILGQTRRYDIRGARTPSGWLSVNFRDVIDRYEAAHRQAVSDALERGLMENSVVPTALATMEGHLEMVNQAACDLVGYDAATLHQMDWQDLTPAEYLDADLNGVQDLLAGRINTYRVTKQLLHADGHRVWVDSSGTLLRNAEGNPHRLMAQMIDITDEVQAREQLQKANRRQAEAVALYRRSMESSAVGMCLVDPEGRFITVNDALCEFFGYDSPTLLTKTWQELTAQDYLQADLDKVADVMAGRIESYRMTKQYIHADGHLIWGDLSVGCLRDSDGQVEVLISQVNDITDEVKARELLAAREEQNRALVQALQTDLDAAARYMTSIMPADLDGTVSVRSRYLPSRALGGDAFDYRWLDDEHMMIKMLDVSGHGIEPALLAVSVHNLLRSGSLSPQILRSPQRVLTELNQLFPMERHSEHYFSLWYGIYRPSTRTLTYAGAGHPPALLFTDRHLTELPSQTSPVGMFTDTDFTATTVPIPTTSQLLLYTDGAFEHALPGGGRGSLPRFITLCTELAQSPDWDWSLDTLIDKLRATSATGTFDDDCSVISVTFD